MIAKTNKSFRCKCKSGIGMHSEYLKTLTDRNLGRAYLNMPKPYNLSELAMLSKFIFGIELSCNFKQFHDYIENAATPRYGWLKDSDSDKLVRFFKLYLLDPNKLDYIPKNKVSHCRSHDDKFVFINLQYFCDQYHDSYYDHKFSTEIFRSSYDVDGCFWRHCIGELYCGGISSHSYGQVEVTSFKEYERLKNLKDNPDQPIRDSFRKEMEKLIEEDKKYDNEKSLEM